MEWAELPVFGWMTNAELGRVALSVHTHPKHEKTAQART